MSRAQYIFVKVLGNFPGTPQVKLMLQVILQSLNLARR